MAQPIDYILLGVATLIIVYILYRMISKSMSESGQTPPPFNNNPNSSQMKQLEGVEQSNKGVSITNASFPISQDNALRNFCIKSSYNSAYTGGYLNLDMVKYVLQRGCRFLDFQVFIKDNVPIVAYSFDDNKESFSSNPPALSLGGVFSTINMNAFNQMSPNPNDPLFIHLKILSNEPQAPSMVAESIAASFDDKLYKDPNTGYAVPIDLNTQMNRLLGKVVILCDQVVTSSPTPSSSPSSNTSSMQLSNYVNLMVGTPNVRSYTEQQLTYQPITPPNPFPYTFKIVTPNLGFFYGINNSDVYHLTQNYGTQVVAQAFYSTDSALTQYEEFFNTYKSAFVPMNGIAN